VLGGSTRLKAGTATKLVLNMLSTGAMVRLGKTFGNLMVDLRATNSKLRARSNRIVRALTQLSVEAADALLRQCDGELKTALVARLANVSPQEARARLAAAGGQVRPAISAPADRRLQIADRKSNESASFCLGIDGGGSRTVALLARQDARGWSVVGRGVTGPSNLQAVGVASATCALDEAVSAAFATAGLRREAVSSACLGLAGADRPQDRQVILDWARQANLAAQVEVTSDVALVLEAGTPAGWGLALIAGTGSIAYGRSADGQAGRAGGWGYLLGDEGSAYALVVAGLQAVARAADGRGPETSLAERFLGKLGLDQPEQLIPLVYQGGWDRAALAALAPLVLEAAATDPVAAQIKEEAAQSLANTAKALARRLGLGAGAVPVALAGSVLLGNHSYRDRVLDALGKAGLRPEPVALLQEPAEGAVRVAGRRAASP
jgi:N-acetylglucosamine kinase-like BadF-type ATPase